MALEQSIVMGIALVYLFYKMLSESERDAQRAERYEVGITRGGAREVDPRAPRRTLSLARAGRTDPSRSAVVRRYLLGLQEAELESFVTWLA